MDAAMKNDNDLILERLRGVPAHKPSYRDKFEPGNPNVPQTNDNEPRRSPEATNGESEPTEGNNAGK